MPSERFQAKKQINFVDSLSDKEKTPFFQKFPHMTLSPHAISERECVLQHIVINMDSISGAEALYVRHVELPFRELRHTTDTYINIFHKKRWQDLTSLSSYRLHVVCRGRGRLELYGISAPANGDYPNTDISPMLLDTCVVDSPTDTVCWTPHLEGPYDFFFFAWEEEYEGALHIEHAQYIACTGSEPRSIKIAIVTTTYQRRKDINQLITTYLQASENIPNFSLVTHLFIVNNEQRDKDFFKQYVHPQITIITSKENLGGSSGFAEGARLAVGDKNFSHVLFMDDDAYIHEEAWFRTFSLLRLIQPLYQDQVISGTMLTKENPTWCHAMQECMTQKGTGVTVVGKKDLSSLQATLELLSKEFPYSRDLNIREQTFLRISPDAPMRPYAAWWYCVIPIVLFHSYGYPLPLFFRGDDQEFGMRLQRLTLSLNGICIWHPDFKNKCNLFRLYLGCRNNAITNILHFKHWRLNILYGFFRKSCLALDANNYKECAARILAIRDFLDFPSVPQNGEGLMLRIQTWLKLFDIELPPTPSIFKNKSGQTLKLRFYIFTYFRHIFSNKISRKLVFLTITSCIKIITSSRKSIVRKLMLQSINSNAAKTTKTGKYI